MSTALDTKTIELLNEPVTYPMMPELLRPLLADRPLEDYEAKEEESDVLTLTVEPDVFIEPVEELTKIPDNVFLKTIQQLILTGKTPPEEVYAVIILFYSRTPLTFEESLAKKGSLWNKEAERISKIEDVEARAVAMESLHRKYQLLLSVGFTLDHTKASCAGFVTRDGGFGILASREDGKLQYEDSPELDPQSDPLQMVLLKYLYGAPLTEEELNQ